MIDIERAKTDLFWSKVDKTPTCWVWTAAETPYGYGVWWNGDRLIMAHRVAYQVARGAIPDGLVIDHLCRNRKCVNPDHLEAVTHQVNILRGVGATADNARKTHCPKGHSYNSDVSFVDGEGRRRCGVCRPRPQRIHNRFRTHCIHGHPFSAENTYIRGNGSRSCKTCAIIRKTAYRKRQKGSRVPSPK